MYRVHHGASANPANWIASFPETDSGYSEADSLCMRLNSAFRRGYRASQTGEIIWNAAFPEYFVTLVYE